VTPYKFITTSCQADRKKVVAKKNRNAKFADAFAFESSLDAAGALEENKHSFLQVHHSFRMRIKETKIGEENYLLRS
jgi:hypothetical protein